jgi:hypothetical protein
LTDETKVVRTTGLKNPDGILGVVPRTFPLKVLYIQRIKNGDTSGSTSLPVVEDCPKTQPYSPPGESSPATLATADYVNVRVAITADGINFTDLGVVNGLNDQTTISYAGTRWIAPGGTILDLGGGRYGLFFGAGNCMDEDPDAFHYIGYAETTDPNLQNWTVINDITNPIASTIPETVPVHGVSTTIPAEAPVVGPTAEWFNARSYSPSVTVFDDHTVTVMFSGYSVYSPKDNLLDYRTIGVVRLTSSRPIPLDARAD